MTNRDPLIDRIEDNLREALEWLADEQEDGQLVIIAYGVPQLASHLAAILADRCWDHRCGAGDHTREVAYCAVGRREHTARVVVPIHGESP